MNRRTLYIVLSTLAMTFAGSDAFAQFMPERHLIRKGNRDYEKENYAESEIDYLRAKGKDSLSFAAGYNLGNAYYRQGRFDEATAAFSKPAPREITPELAAHSFYNAGNAQFQQRKLEEAQESYKESLRINPSDMEAKFNLAYVKKLLEKEQDKNEDQQDNKDDKQDKDQNDDKQQDKNKGQDQDKNQDQKQDDQNQNNDQQGQNQGNDQNDGQQNQQPSGVGKEEAEQMLQAIEMGDEKTREKVDAQKGVAVGGSSKNW